MNTAAHQPAAGSLDLGLIGNCAIITGNKLQRRD